MPAELSPLESFSLLLAEVRAGRVATMGGDNGAVGVLVPASMYEAMRAAHTLLGQVAEDLRENGDCEIRLLGGSGEVLGVLGRVDLRREQQQPPPVVNITMPPIQITMPAMPAQPAPIITVHQVPMETTIERDSDGDIVRTIQKPRGT